MPEQNQHEILTSTHLVRGNPTAAELAAVLAVLDAVVPEEQAQSAVGIRALKSTWSRNPGQLRSEISAGAGQWRATMRHGLH